MEWSRGEDDLVFLSLSTFEFGCGFAVSEWIVYTRIHIHIHIHMYNVCEPCGLLEDVALFLQCLR